MVKILSLYSLSPLHQESSCFFNEGRVKYETALVCRKHSNVWGFIVEKLLKATVRASFCPQTPSISANSGTRYIYTNKYNKLHTDHSYYGYAPFTGFLLRCSYLLPKSQALFGHHSPQSFIYNNIRQLCSSIHIIRGLK
jgi:hypothetical protein